MLLVRLGGRRVFKSALIGSVTRLTGGNVENLNRETAEWAIAGGGPALGLAGGLGSVRSLFTPPGKQGAASLTGAMENVTTTQKVVTSQRQPMMKDVNINVTISIPTGVQLSAVEEAQQSTVIRESVVKSFQAATALVPTMGAAQTAPPPPVKSNSVPSPAKKPDVVKAAEPIRPKAAVPPIRKGSKVPLPQVGIGLVALAGLYALHKGLSSRRREKPRPSGEEASQASGAGGAAVAGEEEATTDSNGQLLKDQKLASELGSKAGEEGTVSEGGSKDLSAQEGETIQSLTGALEGLNHSPTATASPGKALGLTLAGAAVSTPNKLLGSHQHLTEGLDPEPVHAMLVKGAAGGSMGSLSEFAHTHEASELVGTGEGRSMERHAGGEEERRESNSAQAEEEVLKRVDTVVAVLREEYTPEIRTTELVKQAEGAARETGSEAKQPGKKPRVKKLRKRVKSVTRKAAQDNATELGADVYLGGAAKTPELVCEQTEIAEVGPATVIADEAAWVENGGAEGLGEAKLDTKAPDEAALLCEEVAKSTLTVEAAEVAVVPSKAEAEVEPALVGQSETAPECALDDADGGFQDAESSLEEGAESLLESADSLFEVVDGKKGEALQGRTSVVSVLENADDMEGDEASEWRVQKMEEEEKLEVGDPQRWGIGWDLAEAGGQWKTDEAPEGWSAGEKSLAGQRERLPVEGTWSVRNKLEEEGDEEVWSSTVTSLQDDGDVSEDMALQVGESVEQAVFTVAEKAVPDPTAAVLGASVDTETEAGARESEDWSDAVTWHPAVEPEALSSEKDEVALPTDVQLLEAKVAPSVLDRAGLDEGADIPLPPAEGAALVPALETVPVAVESFEIVLGKVRVALL